jgi:large subunit ribosomal protein L17
MRHRKNKSKLNRTSSHRKALLRNLCKSLIEHKRITTTLPKAKELRKEVEKIVTMAKHGETLTALRNVKSKLGNLPYNTLTPKQQRDAKKGETHSYNAHRILLKELFENLAPKYKERPGGYTRIVRMSKRVGDSAELCVIEFV